MLGDTHCHLDFETFDVDRGAVLLRAREVGVTHILNPGIDVVSSRVVLYCAEMYPEVFAAIGIHPNSANSWNADSRQILKNLAAKEKVVAIGEIGLDYYRDRAPRKLQLNVLCEQLELARDSNLPIVLHTRDRQPSDMKIIDDIVEILMDWKRSLESRSSDLMDRPGVFHSFSFDDKTAERMLDLGFFLGITGPITFRNAQILRQVAAVVPLDHLLIETDAPFLTPHPYRGKRNEPGYVRFVAEEIAKIRGTTFEEVAKQTTMNANRLFRWADR